ncbi:MAG: VWA domain-containing protein, partial [Bacteroidales bacterium]|nr:VWA domain-containing protein [Bacteroidales bacterium]
KGRKHILRIIRELLEFNPVSNKTDLNEPLRYLTNAIRKRCTAFIISDFIAPDFDESLRIASNKHDVAALRIFDPAETAIPDIGLVRLYDPESGFEKWVDTSSSGVRRHYSEWWNNFSEKIKNTFIRAGVDSAYISTGEDYVPALIRFFKNR